VRDPAEEPINLVAQRFEGTLDGKIAAAELSLSLAELGELLKRDHDLNRTFGGLMTPGGTVQRQVFEDKFSDLARQLIALRIANAKPKAETREAFKGHTGTVNCVAFSQDGKRIASGSDDKTIRVWDAGRAMRDFAAATETYGVAFSHDGKLLLSGGRDRLVRLWDLETGKQIRTFEGHTDSVRTVAFSPNGKWAASAGDDKSVRIWNVATGEEKTALTGHTAAITSLAWSTDGKRLLSGSRDGTARLWSRKQGKALALLEGHSGAVLGVALAPDGNMALTGGNDKTIRLWNLAEANEVHCFKGHANAVIQLQFAGEREFVSASSQHRSADKAFRRWNIENRKEIGGTTPRDDLSFGCAAFSRDGRHVIVGGPSGFLKLWSW